MKIFINGEAKELEVDDTIQDILISMDIVGQRLAVEVNEEIVPKSRHEEYTFQAEDKIEIVHAIGGG